jgi:hypothetical protein
VRAAEWSRKAAVENQDDVPFSAIVGESNTAAFGIDQAKVRRYR